MKVNCGPRPLATGSSDASLWREKPILNVNQDQLLIAILARGSCRISVRPVAAARNFHAIALWSSGIANPFSS